MDTLLVRRFPRLAQLPRCALGRFPSPVQLLALPHGALWIKRDDLNADAHGGNKLRALEFLLGSAHAGDTVLTVGGEGSTHVLTTAALGRSLGVRTVAVRWRHEMNDVANVVAERAAATCERVVSAGGVVRALVRSTVLQPNRRWIPPGGTSPLGMMGHVEAGLELAEQISDGELPIPSRVVVPLGTGGTVAGIALGFAIAGIDVTVLGARVVPRVVANRSRTLYLAERARAFLARKAGVAIPAVRGDRVDVIHTVYGGAYGRALPAEQRRTLAEVAPADMALDGTYTEKAFAAALPFASNPGITLYWHTFDARWMAGGCAA